MLRTRVALLAAPFVMSIGLGCTTQDAAPPDREPQLELRLHAYTPDLQLIEFDGRRIWMTRDERQALRAKGGFEEALAEPRSHRVAMYATLINHTDTSYLLSFSLAEGLVGTFKDPDGQRWQFQHFVPLGGPSAYSLLSVAQTERSIVFMGVEQRMIKAGEEPTSHRAPAAPEHLPEWLEYESHVEEYPARVIQDGKLGEHTTVPMSGTGRMKVTTTGPIPYR